MSSLLKTEFDRVVRAAEWEGHRNYDMLIGMDIISRGKFVIDNGAGKTVFMFTV